MAAISIVLSCSLLLYLIYEPYQASGLKIPSATQTQNRSGMHLGLYFVGECYNCACIREALKLNHLEARRSVPDPKSPR